MIALRTRANRPVSQQPPQTLGHAHNDEMHAQPLTQALGDGFTSIEVDIHNVDGRLLVGHSYADAVEKNLSLKDTYLSPLQQRVQENGAVYPNGPEVTLMLDFKGDASSTYETLLPLLSDYSSMLVHCHQGEITGAPVRVVITGNRPSLKPEEDRSVFLDANLRDVLLHPDQADSRLTPTVSGNYRIYFRWNGQGSMPAQEQKRLSDMANQAHQKGMQLRLWDAPDQSVAWETFARLGVDRINTDDLDGFAQWHASLG